MKKLVRGNAPLCLAQFKHGQDNWSIIREKNLGKDIWEKLDIMQQGFCAYCECSLYINGSRGHIEHFIQRDKDPHLTFDWGNLFGSCNNKNRCGTYKDNNRLAKGIDLSKVCKPDMIGSSDLILFLNSGKVRPRTNLGSNEKELANNTIAAFNLDGDSKLENSRRTAISAEKSLADTYWEMSVEYGNDLAELLKEELAEALLRIKKIEYSTALEHLWTHNEQF